MFTHEVVTHFYFYLFHSVAQVFITLDIIRMYPFVLNNLLLYHSKLSKNKKVCVCAFFLLNDTCMLGEVLPSTLQYMHISHFSI